MLADSLIKRISVIRESNTQDPNFVPHTGACNPVSSGFSALIHLISCVRESGNSLGELFSLVVKMQRPFVIFKKVSIVFSIW